MCTYYSVRYSCPSCNRITSETEIRKPCPEPSACSNNKVEAINGSLMCAAQECSIKADEVHQEICHERRHELDA